MEWTQEKEIERYLERKAKAFGGIAKKWKCPGWDGASDRIVILPKNRIAFVELKKPGELPRLLQIKRAKLLSGLGCKVYCGISSKAAVDGLLEEMVR